MASSTAILKHEMKITSPTLSEVSPIRFPQSPNIDFVPTLSDPHDYVPLTNHLVGRYVSVAGAGCFPTPENKLHIVDVHSGKDCLLNSDGVSQLIAGKDDQFFSASDTQVTRWQSNPTNPLVIKKVQTLSIDASSPKLLFRTQFLVCPNGYQVVAHGAINQSIIGDGWGYGLYGFFLFDFKNKKVTHANSVARDFSNFQLLDDSTLLSFGGCAASILKNILTPHDASHICTGLKANFTLSLNRKWAVTPTPSTGPDTPQQAAFYRVHANNDSKDYFEPVPNARVPLHDPIRYSATNILIFSNGLAFIKMNTWMLYDIPSQQTVSMGAGWEWIERMSLFPDAQFVMLSNCKSYAILPTEEFEMNLKKEMQDALPNFSPSLKNIINAYAANNFWSEARKKMLKVEPSESQQVNFWNDDGALLPNIKR